LLHCAILDVGFGNGYESYKLLKNSKGLVAVDISGKALEFAKKKYPHLVSFVNEAESLTSIETGSVDLYLSFRAFQSTLFDVKLAVQEALRVLVRGGKMVVSVPCLYLDQEGNVLKGLQDTGTNEVGDEYASRKVRGIKTALETPGFSDVAVSTASPYEHYIYAQKD